MHRTAVDVVLADRRGQPPANNKRTDAPCLEVLAMFNLRVRTFSSRGTARWIRLPAAVAFPTDIRLLERIERSRKALPVNSIKPLRRVTRH